MTQLIHRREATEPKAPVEIDNHERLVRLAFFVAVLLILAVATGFIPFLGVIFVIMAIVMLHELGHFATAKWSGMKVSEYFFGFGPRLWSIKKGETEYGIKAIPAGGYVRILGMNNLEQVDPADEARTYRQKSYPRRLLVAVAGSTVHFIIAFLLLVVIWAAVGYPKPTTTIGTVFGAGAKSAQQSPAQKAGLRVGDQVLAVNGHVVHNWDTISPYVKSHENQPVEFIVQRGNHLLKLTVVPSKIVLEGQEGVAVGISPKAVPNKVSLPLAFWHAGADFGHYTTATFGALSVFSPGHLRDYTSQLSGHGAVSGNEADRPVSIIGFVRVAGQAAQTGWLDFLILLVAINIFIGIFNLIPLLPLDGGHVAIATYERIRSRKGRPRYQADVTKLLPLTAAFTSVLIIFGAMIMYLDVMRPIANPFH